MGLQTIWKPILSWKKRHQFKCAVRNFNMVPSLQICLVNFCNSFSVNLENAPMKDNLKYWKFFLVLLGSVSLGLFMIYLLKYLLTDLLINLDGYCFFFSRSKWKPSHVLFKRKVWSMGSICAKNCVLILDSARTKYTLE